jgi:hypothetical protein
MTRDQISPGDGIRLAQLIEVPNFDASYFWPDIPLLLVLGDEEGYAETGIIRPAGAACSSTGVLDLTQEVEQSPVSLDALVVPVCSKSDRTNSRPVVVGRSGGNDICLNHKSISKYHAQFIPPTGEKGWRIRDCGSLNGTWIEGIQVNPEDDFASRGFADITFGALHCRFIYPPVLTALVRLVRDAEYAKNAEDTDVDIPDDELPESVQKERRERLATRTIRDFSAWGNLEEIQKPRQGPEGSQ